MFCVFIVFLTFISVLLYTNRSAMNSAINVQDVGLRSIKLASSNIQITKVFFFKECGFIMHLIGLFMINRQLTCA